YLAVKVQDEEEIPEDTFKKMEANAQKDFFAELAKKNKINEAMDKTPKDVKEISFSLGNFKHYQDFNEACKVVADWKAKIIEFKNLKKMTLDLSGLAYYTPKVAQLLNTISNLYLLHKTFNDINIDRGKNVNDTYWQSSLGKPNNFSAVSSAI